MNSTKQHLVDMWNKLVLQQDAVNAESHKYNPQYMQLELSGRTEEANEFLVDILGPCNDKFWELNKSIKNIQAVVQLLDNEMAEGK